MLLALGESEESEKKDRQTDGERDRERVFTSSVVSKSEKRRDSNGR